MKILVSNPFVKCALVLAFGCWAARAESQTNATSRTAPPALIKSVFVTDARAKDPFFPNSTRGGREVIETPQTTNSTPQPGVNLTGLALKGISGPIGQRLALINSSTVAIGEWAEIRLGQQTVRIRCLEIRDSSVVIALDGTGETKELKLREGA